MSIGIAPKRVLSGSDVRAKPFAYGELRLRVAALLRRSRDRRVEGGLRVGELEVDPASRDVRVRGRRVLLSQKEYALLRRLATDPTRVWTKAELLRDVWGFRTLGTTRTLDSHACRLRQKLSLRGDRFVLNVWGVGYRLIDGEVTEPAAAATAAALDGVAAPGGRRAGGRGSAARAAMGCRGVAS